MISFKWIPESPILKMDGERVIIEQERDIKK